jgi:hypothetical protein
MSAPPGTALRTLAFGDLDAGLWVASAGAADQVTAVVASALTADQRPASSVVPIVSVRAQLAGSAPDEQWELTGDALQLRVTVENRWRVPGDGPFAQPCRVAGRLELDGVEREVDCLGVRSSVPDLNLRALDSLRQVLVWFADDDAIALSSVRPRGAEGQDRDVVAAAVFEPEGRLEVEEGRLSTTYAAGDAPTRMSLELWLTDEEEQFPRRAAGESLGSGASGTAAEAEIGLYALRCHSHGRDGAGAYVVARPR